MAKRIRQSFSCFVYRRPGGTAWVRTQQNVRSCNALASGAEGLVLRSEGVWVADATLKAKKAGVA